MAYLKGKDLLVTIGSDVMLGQQDCEISITGEAIDAFGKADYPVKKKVPGWTEWQITASQLIDLTDAANVALATAAATALTVSVTLAVDSVTYSGTAIATNFSKSGGKEGMATSSCTLTGGDLLTIA